MTTSKKIGIGCACALVCCCGGSYSLLQGLFGSAASKRDAEVAAARKAGIPVDPAGLSAMLNVPDDRNAAPIYRQAMKLEEGDEHYDKDLKTIRDGLAKKATVAQRQAMAEALGRVGPLQKMVEKAGDMPSCDFHHDWSLGAKLLFPEFAHMKSWGRLLCADAELRSERGDWRGALKQIERSERIAHHSGQDPILIGMLVGVATEAITVAALQRVIEDHRDNPAFVSEALKTVKQFGSLPDFRRAMMGELVLGRASIRGLNGSADLQMTGEPHAEPNRWEKAFFQSPQVQGAFDAKLVEAYRKMIEALPKDPSQWEKSYQVAVERGRAVEADHSIANTLNQIIMPVFEQAAQSVGQALMRRRLAITTLKLLDEKAHKRAFPRLLPNFGDDRIDPFSGKPLHYLREDSGFLLYSVGKDRVDDGGAGRDPKDSSKTFDESIHIK
ncbi:hypothetical protein [Fimbriimonas ginsengisoli]|uniref:Uncharacterized protein n=1 Tax=Fimbriimonas ginsengisoli Gsoil 348 TaxID=661478 RepID=A0A068NNL9_FIMGI|nr:hypothetical protein [Fimbriimonas ginsengisoli]AIE84997.1 hypothetical protein OP10G_1629 [Fimbriimonas ginsengisoli Gsoil 348]